MSLIGLSFKLAVVSFHLDRSSIAGLFRLDSGCLEITSILFHRVETPTLSGLLATVFSNTKTPDALQTPLEVWLVPLTSAYS